MNDSGLLNCVLTTFYICSIYCTCIFLVGFWTAPPRGPSNHSKARNEKQRERNCSAQSHVLHVVNSSLNTSSSLILTLAGHHFQPVVGSKCKCRSSIHSTKTDAEKISRHWRFDLQRSAAKSCLSQFREPLLVAVVFSVALHNNSFRLIWLCLLITESFKFSYTESTQFNIIALTTLYDCKHLITSSSSRLNSLRASFNLWMPALFQLCPEFRSCGCTASSCPRIQLFSICEAHIE